MNADPAAVPPANAVPPGFDAGRALVFAIGIGVPIVAGFAFGSPSTALFAGVGALNALFTDPRRGAVSRLVFIAAAMAALLAAAVLGGALRPHPHAALLATLAVSIPAGLVPPTLPYLAMVAKLVPVALVAVASNQFDGTAVLGGFLAGTVFATAVTLVEAALRGVAQYAHPWREWVAVRGGARNDTAYAVAYVAAVGAALVAAEALGISRPMWALVTVLFVMQPETAGAGRRIGQRIAGTLAGVAVAWLVVTSGTPVAGVLVVTVAVAAAIPWGIARGPFAGTLAGTAFVLLLFDVGMIAEGGDAPLIAARIWDTLIGTGAVALASLALRRWHGRRTARPPAAPPPAA